jgi:transcriptional regulator with XRE-family HTH domain
LNNDNYGTGKNNTSGITGVCPGPNGMWIAQIGYNGKIYNIGSFKTKEQAADARYLAEQKCKADFLKQRVDFEEEPQKFDCQFRVTPLQAQWLHEHFGGNAEICAAVRSLMIQNSRRVVYVAQPKPSERTIMFTLSLYNGERELLDAQTTNLREKLGRERIARSEALNCCIARLYPDYGNLYRVPNPSRRKKRTRHSSNPDSPFGRAIAESGMSIKDLSSATGISTSALYSYTSERITPTAETVQKISAVLGCDANALPSCARVKSVLSNQDSEIVKAMNYSNITVSELSERTGIAKNQIYGYIKGYRAPRPATLKKITEATGYPLDIPEPKQKQQKPPISSSRNANHPLMKAIKSAGLTVQDVASAAGISRASLYYYMDGTFELREENLQKIADFIGCSVSDLKITKK